MTDRQLQYAIIEDGAKRYGLDLKGARIWQFWKHVLYVLELEQLSDEVIPRKTETDRRGFIWPVFDNNCSEKDGSLYQRFVRVMIDLRSLS